MARKRIFIGSASESIATAKKISQILSASNYLSIRWWNEFEPGSITLDRLIEISDDIDGAIFIMTASDVAWYRGEKASVPRDNLLLEYGLFVRAIGRKRTVILKGKEVKLPSDIDSITYENLLDDIDTVGERIIDHFDGVFADKVPDSNSSTISIIVDPTILNRAS